MSKQMIAFTFNDKPIYVGDNYFECCGFMYFSEDENEFLGYLTGQLGSGILLQKLGSKERNTPFFN